MLLNHMRFRHPRCSSSACSDVRTPCSSVPVYRRSVQTCKASSSRSSEGSSQQDDGRWWDGPAPGGGSSVPEGPVPKMPQELSHADTEVLQQGPEEAARWENIRKNERQRGEWSGSHFSRQQSHTESFLKVAQVTQTGIKL